MFKSRKGKFPLFLCPDVDEEGGLLEFQDPGT